jgi:hypothetical protein
VPPTVTLIFRQRNASHCVAGSRISVCFYMAGDKSLVLIFPLATTTCIQTGIIFTKFFFFVSQVQPVEAFG